MNSIKLVIPFMSISINGAYSGKVKRFKSQNYKDFEYKMEKFFLEHGVKYEIEGNNWLSVKYDFYFPIYNKNGTIKVKDLGNFEKALTDTLAHHIPGFLDEKIKHMSLNKWDSDREYMEITIQEL